MSMAAGYEVDWNLVRTFVSVVEAGSLAGAARALELAHPTVARHVQQLEGQLGVALFDRSASGLALNEAGQRLADVAVRMRHEARTLESVSESVRSETTGRVRITIADLLADLLPELLAPLKELEGAEARFIELIVSRERLNLLEREADMAIRHMRPEQTELVCRKLGSMPMGAWASAAYLERFGPPSMDNLDGHRFIDGLSTRGFTLALERLGHKVPDSQVSFRTDCLQSQRRAAELGWGLIGMPDYLAERTPGLIKVLGDVPEAVTLDIWLVARPAMRGQKLLRLVYDTLVDGLTGAFSSPLPKAAQGNGSAPAPASNESAPLAAG
jgi:DNA-binding transcriptional LysR family regulator